MKNDRDLCWIRDNGICAEADLPGLVQSFRQQDDRAVAFYTDCFQGADSGHVTALLEPSDWMRDPMRNLLELRVFRKDAEFWAHRTGVGLPFSWRIADDSVIAEKSGETDEKEAMERYTFKTKHILDISPEYQPYKDGETDEFGCRKLRSSIGGKYALPLGDIGDKQSYGFAVLVNYVSYDDNGIAGVADVRLSGFEPMFETL